MAGRNVFDDDDLQENLIRKLESQLIKQNNLLQASKKVLEEKQSFVKPESHAVLTAKEDTQKDERQIMNVDGRLNFQEVMAQVIAKEFPKPVDPDSSANGRSNTEFEGMTFSVESRFSKSR
jgi:hypothetical protein